MPDKKEWTLIFYLASDNPLAPGVISQLKSIKAAGFHKDANVIVQFDPYTESTPTHIFDVNVIKKVTSQEKYQIGFTANDPTVHNLLEDRLWNDETDRHGASIRETLVKKYEEYQPGYNPGVPDLDKVYDEAQPYEPGPQKSLEAFLTFCADFYPAKHYILFLLGHGVVVGNDVFMYDEHADEKTLSLAGLRSVLETFNKKLALHEGSLDLLSFHSCSVSSLEVAYELKDQARYMLASQGSTMIGNWPYRQILIRIFNDLVDHGSVHQRAIKPLCEDIFSFCVSNSTDFLLAGYPYDLCLCDLTKVGPTKEALERLSKALIGGLRSDTFKDLILLAHLESQSFHYEMYTDILDFCRCLYRRTAKSTISKDLERTRTGIEQALEHATKVISECIVHSNCSGPESQYARGLSLYFPWSRPLDNFLEKYAAYEIFNPRSESMWVHFLRRYFWKTRRDSIGQQRTEENAIKELGETFDPKGTNELRDDQQLREDQIAVVYGQATTHYTAATYTLDGEKPTKTDVTDPLGGMFAAPSIKNYPRDTRRLRKRTSPRGKELRQRFPLDAGTCPSPTSP